MLLQYGMNITASDMKSLLEKNDKLRSGVRTWRQLFGNASLGYNAQSDALTTDYSNIIAEAYKTNFAQSNAIRNAGLSEGVTKEMLAQSQNNIRKAYETYILNYNKDMSTAAENYSNEVSAIDTALNERAANFSNLYNSAYKYLSDELYGSYRMATGTADNGAEAVYTGKGRNTKLDHYEPIRVNYFDEYGLDWLTIEDPVTKEKRLMSWNEISHLILNKDGSLTPNGVKFFDQLFNATPQGYKTAADNNARSFDEWLSAQEDDFGNYDSKLLPGMAKNGQELRDWLVSEDMFNYNFAGTNYGTANILSGRESTDSEYGAYEYADTHGMSEFSKFDFGESNSLVQDAITKLAEADARLVTFDTPFGPGELKSSEHYDRAHKAWTDYQGQINTVTNELDAFFKNKMGSTLYAEFIQENKSLYNEYATLIDKAKSVEYYDKDVANDLNKWYNNLLKQMNAYIKKHGYTGKTSGF